MPCPPEARLAVNGLQRMARTEWLDPAILISSRVLVDSLDWWTPTMKNSALALLVFSLLLSSSSVSAQDCPCNSGQCHAGQCGPNGSGTWHGNPGFCWRCEAGYHANNLWPAQYIPTARCAVNSAYTAMINNGWRRQNLLGDYHFQEGTNELTSAGQLKAKWILTQAPQDRRTIYVQRGNTQSDTASRIAAVHGWAGNQSPQVEPVLVNDTHIVSEGHTAGSVDHIFVGFQENQPAPVLVPDSGGGTTTAAQ